VITGHAGRFGDSGQVESGNVSILKNNHRVRMDRVSHFENNDRVMMWHARALEITAG
jgi:hypothetical protein